ncbi:hypothetical protein HPB51_014126 [Rhipicephalus microplus]|uniref:Uncharacterized protein n=1 Tax=Rhipicephalus microplus TaxID=6941 RepID=A0A9J6E108_RHIMP|nr:hypothetical protein HPB51_014126 [Rhipicephalus microplus]
MAEQPTVVQQDKDKRATARANPESSKAYDGAVHRRLLSSNRKPAADVVPGGPIPPRSSDESFVPRNRRRIPQGPAVAPAHRPATQWSASTVAAFAELSGGDIALASKTSLAAGRNRLLRRRKTRLEGGQLSGHLKRRDDMCKHSASLGLSTRITNNPVPGIHNTSTHTLVGVPERHAHRTPKLP